MIYALVEVVKNTKNATVSKQNCFRKTKIESSSNDRT